MTDAPDAEPSTDGGEGPADQLTITAHVVERTPDAAIVANLGVASWLLAEVEDRERNFYMRGAMGSTTPTGFGVALGTDDPVVVLDGDGSMLMSLGSLAVLGRYDLPNLVVVICDNSEFATTGGQPTLSSIADFAAIATDCGLESFTARTEAEFESAYGAALEHDGTALVSCAVTTADVGAPPEYDYAHAYLTHRFREAMVDD